MENSFGKLTRLDELYLQRTYELAGRAIGSTSPNPPVGAVVVRDGRIAGEGYHHWAGDAHAEASAIAKAGPNARGSTLYVSLEPCRHVGRTPPCTRQVIDAGVVRVVAGALDPSEHGGGAAELRERGIEVVVAPGPAARDLIETFARSAESHRPYVALKMAMSLDGYIASRPGLRERLGSEAEEAYVRDLRTAYDAVMVGAGTVRVDDPRLTVRPPHDRRRPYVRIVACQTAELSPRSRVFAQEDGYAKTLVLVPAARRDRFKNLDTVAEVVQVGPPDSHSLDLPDALKTLRERDIFSVLCEGGPHLAASLLAAGCVDRLYWAIVPRFLSGADAVPVLSGADLGSTRLRFDRVHREGPDVIISALVEGACLPV